MKKNLLTLFLLFSLVCFAQTKKENYVIIKLGTKYSKDLVELAFSKANMCGNFFNNKPNDIVFDDGTVVRLSSKKEILSSSNFSDDCFLSDDFKIEDIKWSILPSGQMMKGYPARLKTKSNF